MNSFKFHLKCALHTNKTISSLSPNSYIKVLLQIFDSTRDSVRIEDADIFFKNIYVHKNIARSSVKTSFALVLVKKGTVFFNMWVWIVACSIDSSISIIKWLWRCWCVRVLWLLIFVRFTSIFSVFYFLSKHDLVTLFFPKVGIVWILSWNFEHYFRCINISLKWYEFLWYEVSLLLVILQLRFSKLR